MRCAIPPLVHSGLMECFRERSMDSHASSDHERVAAELGLGEAQVAAVARLLEDGNTVPFITRYRKERTGSLDEAQIRAVQSRLTELRQLAERAATVLRQIEAQGRLTPQLKAAVLAADSLKRLEDLYLPFRPKKRSRAAIARERGLAPLAERIWNGDIADAALDSVAGEFVAPDRDLPHTADVLRGAADLLAEHIGEDADFREQARRIAWSGGRLVVRLNETHARAGEFRNYADYAEPLSRVPPHRVLAINRGEKLETLRVRCEWDTEALRQRVAERLGCAAHPCGRFLAACGDEAIARFIGPALEREIRRELTERAESQAIEVFVRNLRNLLLMPPLRGSRVLAIDPAFRTGAKIAVLDEFGKPLIDEVVYVTGSAEKRAAARKRLAELLEEYACRMIAIGNGTACRETEELVADTIEEHVPDARYCIVNEAGASVYSAGDVAREEFPELDATVRGTISIGRRLQDPLSELVKIEPRHIGVGMYQHDISPKRLSESLETVVESCVNFVGVDLSTASAPLLRRV
ncbi:MAG: RNA-binding transcriptional accessory protein, partial [Planctomycetes bacterium]|nr:RNA-binding transcriptional accessory protein [Planctomycetota bacterium]